MPSSRQDGQPPAPNASVDPELIALSKALMAGGQGNPRSHPQTTPKPHPKTRVVVMFTRHLPSSLSLAWTWRTCSGPRHPSEFARLRSIQGMRRKGQLLLSTRPQMSLHRCSSTFIPASAPSKWLNFLDSSEHSILPVI